MNRFTRWVSAIALALIALPAAAQIDPTVTGLSAATAPSGSEIVDIRQNGQKKAATVAQLQGLQTPPPGFAWDFVAHPLNVYRSPNGRYTTDLDPRSIPSIKAIFDGAASGTTGVVYADAAAANNSGAGLTPATARQGIRSALAACEADATKTTGCIAYVKAGEYDRTRDFMGTLNQTAATISKPTALVCYGGNCVLSSAQLGLSWAANGTYSTVYQASRSNVGRVQNKLANDSFGDPNDFALQASIAAVAACVTQDCRYNDGAVEYIKRADGAVPSDSNTRVVLAVTDTMDLGSAAVSFYVSGFTVYGGTFGTLRAMPATLTARDLVVEDSSFVGPTTAGGNAISIDNTSGLAAFFRVTGSKGNADIFNPHANAGGALDMLLVDTIARDTGRGSQSSNCITAHDGSASLRSIRLIVINGSCTAASGGAFRDIGYSDAWVMNYSIDIDRGDVAAGGSILSTCFNADNSARMWLQDSRCSRTLNSVVVTGTASIGLRRFSDGGGLRVTAGGSIAPY